MDIDQLRVILQNNIKYLESMCVIEEIKDEVLDRICSIEIALEEKLPDANEEDKIQILELLALIEDVKKKHMPKSTKTSKTLS